jgi:Family of unknown function (DUF5995)
MKFLATVIIAGFFFNATAQLNYNQTLLDTLQEIAYTNTPSKYFAALYKQAIKITNIHAHQQPENVKQFIFGLESFFAPTFFRSYQNFINCKPQAVSWQQYYADTTLNELQYQFMGMNAHINGDLWLALKDKYSYDTIQKYKRPLIKFQVALNALFDSVYITAGKYKKIRQLHLFTLGLDKNWGRRMVLHWRKRQLKLALLFYTNPKKCNKKLKKLTIKMQHYNSFALRWLK